MSTDSGRVESKTTVPFDRFAYASMASSIVIGALDTLYRDERKDSVRDVFPATFGTSR